MDKKYWGLALIVYLIANFVLTNEGFSQHLLGKDEFKDAVVWKNEWKAGETPHTLILTMEGKIRKGLHVFSAVPPKKDANLPTTFELLDGTKGVTLTEKLKEDGKIVKEFDSIFETDLMYYKENVKFIQKITVKDGYKGKGRLKFQVCDEEGKCTMLTQEIEITKIQP